MEKYSILFICMGNICRSPAAEGVMRQVLEKSRMNESVKVDSAGTHDYHIGEAPDPRIQRAALKRGIDLSGLRARKVQPEDFERYDLLLAMDQDNLALLRRGSPAKHRHKLDLFMRYSADFAAEEVPDPYYGDDRDFELVLDMAEDAARGLIGALKQNKAG